MSDRNKAFELQERLQENCISDTSLLDYLVNNYFSGAEVLGAMESALVNFGLEDEDEDEDQYLEVGMEVEVVDKVCNECVLSYQDVGTITEIDNNEWFRVVVDGRPTSGNWMRASQLARINY
jgi:hypothetical protein